MHALTFDTSDGWNESKGFRKREVPTPTLVEPADAEAVIVQVRFAGVCGSDRGIWFRDAFKDMILGSLEKEGKSTRIIGHEFFGEIVAAGSLVAEKFSLNMGDTVSAESHVTCGKCFQCHNGELHVCTEEKILGISFDGCFAELVKLPAKVLWLTDTAKIRPEIAAMQEPFGNAVHACTKVDLRGKRVAVFGCGPIGLMTVLVSRSMGASMIIGVEPNPTHAALAKSLGADLVVDIPKVAKAHPWQYEQAVMKTILEATRGIGVDVAIEMSGYNSSVNTAVQSVRRGGDVILFGLKSGDFTIEKFDRMIVRGVTLHSVIGRQIFKTWYITKSLLEDASNHIQEKLWMLLLKEGQGTVLPFADYDPARFEQALLGNPKILLKF